MQVKDIMTRAVGTIPEETTVEDAARIMKVNGIGLLPIALCNKSFNLSYAGNDL